MNETFAVETTIARPVEDVWAVLTDWDNAPQWMSGIEWMKSSGETVAGATLTFHARGKERRTEIVRCQEGRSILLRSRQGRVTADYEYKLHSISEDKTRVTLVASCDTQGVMWTALSPLLRLAVRLTDSGQLEALKHIVEAQ